MLLKTTNVLKHSLFLLYDLLSRKRKPINYKNKLLIVDIGLIGDYIIFRNYLETLRNNNKYKNWTITLIGNEDWKKIAEEFDSAYVDNFIWINRNLFMSSILYRFKKLQMIKTHSFQDIIYPRSSRELFTASIVKHSIAHTKIGSISDERNAPKWQIKIMDKWFDQLISSGESNFEFYKLKYFFNHVLNEKISFQKPFFLTIKKLNTNDKSDYFVIFPGASNSFKRWSTTNFAYLIDMIIDSFQTKRIFIAGSHRDQVLAQEIFTLSKYHNQLIDLTGKTTLPDLVELLSNAELLISNDTSAIHIAASVDTPTICISAGEQYGKYLPYPADMNVKMEVLLPIEITKYIDNESYLIKHFSTSIKTDINSIEVIDVFSRIETIFKKIK